MLNKLKKEKPWLYNMIALVTIAVTSAIIGLSLVAVSVDLVRTFILVGLFGSIMGSFVFDMGS